MKLVVNRDLFARALARVQGVVSRKSSMQAISNVLLQASTDGRLRVAATDLDVTFDGAIAARIGEPGEITVDGKRLYEVIRSLPGEEVDLSVGDAHQVKLVCKNTEFTLLGATADQYPELPSAAGVAFTPVDGLALRQLIDRTIFSVSTDESRPNLNGVFFRSLGGGRLRMVSTDGHRLSQGERDAGREGDIAEHDGVIIPRKGVSELSRLLGEVGADVRFGFLDNNLVVGAEDLTLFVRLIDAAFPDYRQVIPKASGKKAVVNRLAFLDSLKRISILASERTHGVRIEVHEGRMVLSSDNPDLGKAREELPIEGYNGDELVIAFNARYVRDILGILDAEKVELALNESLAPGLFREHGNEDYLFVVMPMRL
ncbi:MAG: DNA polymerase III subunit beta [Myxococcales bacterium]|nr:DNA polymerase III subunit beta [Myxococcales bacterium]MCB9522744.1 DNA polymerase III subunit beta [Myxococcales bacterium]